MFLIKMGVLMADEAYSSRSIVMRLLSFAAKLGK